VITTGDLPRKEKIKPLAGVRGLGKHLLDGRRACIGLGGKDQMGVWGKEKEKLTCGQDHIAIIVCRFASRGEARKGSGLLRLTIEGRFWSLRDALMKGSKTCLCRTGSGLRGRLTKEAFRSISRQS